MIVDDRDEEGVQHIDEPMPFSGRYTKNDNVC